MLCQCTGICTPHAAPCASAQFADEAPPRPSVRSCLAPPASVPPTRPPALPPNHGDAAYLGEPAPQILMPMLPAVPVCPPTSPSSLVQWANLLLPLRTRLPSLCALMSRVRRPAGGIRRPFPRSQTRPPPEVHAEPPPSWLRDEPRLLRGRAPRGPPVPIRPRPDGTRYCPPLP